MRSTSDGWKYVVPETDGPETVKVVTDTSSGWASIAESDPKKNVQAVRQNEMKRKAKLRISMTTGNMLRSYAIAQKEQW